MREEALALVENTQDPAGKGRTVMGAQDAIIGNAIIQNQAPMMTILIYPPTNMQKLRGNVSHAATRQRLCPARCG